MEIGFKKGEVIIWGNAPDGPYSAFSDGWIANDGQEQFVWYKGYHKERPESQFQMGRISYAEAKRWMDIKTHKCCDHCGGDTPVCPDKHMSPCTYITNLEDVEKGEKRITCQAS